MSSLIILISVFIDKLCNFSRGMFLNHVKKTDKIIKQSTIQFTIEVGEDEDIGYYVDFFEIPSPHSPTFPRIGGAYEELRV